MNEFKVFFNYCIELLNKVGSTESQSEAQLIFGYVLKTNIGKLKFEKNIDKKHKKQIIKIINKRKKNIPLQYLLKEVEFLNLKLSVNKNVLIPRNETEQLADIIVNDIKKLKQNKSLNVLDMCCGSGALGLSIDKNTKTFVTLTDISKKALEVAKNNAKINQIKNVEIKKSDLFAEINKKYDVFVSNPPYIKTQEIEILQKEVKFFEPTLALDGGKDGFKFYQDIIKALPKYLLDEALVYFEVGINQAKQVFEMLATSDFENIEIIKDYYGVERIVKASKKRKKDDR